VPLIQAIECNTQSAIARIKAVMLFHVIQCPIEGEVDAC
jgi:hypothetical protein